MMERLESIQNLSDSIFGLDFFGGVVLHIRARRHDFTRRSAVIETRSSLAIKNTVFDLVDGLAFGFGDE